MGSVRSGLMPGLALALALSSPVQAQDASGPWRCLGTDALPAGALTIAPDGHYTFEAAPGADEARAGEGMLVIIDSQIMVQSGPLATAWAVVGEHYLDGDDESLFWSANGAAVMQCWRAGDPG